MMFLSFVWKAQVLVVLRLHRHDKYTFMENEAEEGFNTGRRFTRMRGSLFDSTARNGQINSNDNIGARLPEYG